MLSFIKELLGKLFGSKPAVKEAPYKVETPVVPAEVAKPAKAKAEKKPAAKAKAPRKPRAPKAQ